MTSNLVGIFPKDMEVTAINGNDYMAFWGISPFLIFGPYIPSLHNPTITTLIVQPARSESMEDI